MGFDGLTQHCLSKGIKLIQEAMESVEAQIERLPALGKWFVDIAPPAMTIWIPNYFYVPLCKVETHDYSIGW
jgi:hypothetical protein